MRFTPAPSSSGFSTIECLVALMVFSVGILGAAGTMGLATRAVHAGAAASHSARATQSIADSLAAAVLRAGGSCAALGSGSRTSGAIRLDWRSTPVPGGHDIELTASHPGLGRPVTDTLRGWVTCH